jgi:beta-N-acetylhexosaminidase
MSAKWQPGPLLFCGFDGNELPDDLAELVRTGRVGGVVLFARNVCDPAQLRTLTRSLHACAPDGAPLLIAIDQEGGRVQRMRQPWTEWPPMRSVGDADDPDLTRSIARALARELADFGITLDFAPVVDVDTNPDNPVIGDRSFGRDPQRVIQHTVNFIQAMQEAGVAACAKHFPGHGDTSTDSHHELPIVGHELERLRAVELPPFAAAIEAGVASIMTAHVQLSALDPELPATISPAVMSILREELGYEGVVFSDDLEMKAVADHYDPEALVSGCLAAGVDALIVGRSSELRDIVLHELEAAPPERIRASLTRIAALKTRFAAPPEAPEAGEPPYPDHLALAERPPTPIA